MTWSGRYSSRAPAPKRRLTRCTESAPLLRYTRVALGVARHTCAPAPSSTRVSSRSPPSTPPVGLRRKRVAAPVSSRSTGSRACRGSVKRRRVRTVRSPCRSNATSRRPSRPVRSPAGSGLEEKLSPDPIHDEVGASPVPEIAEDKRPVSSHALRVALHDPEVGADIRREIDLVDDEQVRSRYPGPAFARNLLALRHVDHVDGGVHKLRAERGRKVVAAAFNEEHLESGEPPDQLVHGLEVDGGVLPDRR